MHWAKNWTLGWSGPKEIERYGIVNALHLAGQRALAGLRTPPGQVILDGNQDWLTSWPTLFAPDADPQAPTTVTLVKADQTCASVAAASVLAKVARDRFMEEASVQYPGFGWKSNKGYGTLVHRTAIDRLGLSPLHRPSWVLRGDEKAEL